MPTSPGCTRTDSGTVADCIPPLALADPNSFGISVTTTEGHSYEVGDSRVNFTIQSMSKPFTYGLALQDRGFDAVDGKVGVEPSGEAFNSISLLLRPPSTATSSSRRWRASSAGWSNAPPGSTSRCST